MLRSTVLTAGIAILLMAGCGQDQSSSGSRTVEVKGNPRIDLDRAYSIGDFKTAIPLIREKLEQKPKDGREWFRLGYALHAEEDYAGAIDAYENAAKFDATQRSISIYNWACALCLNDKPDAALAKLEEAVKAGFNRKRTIMEDDDFESIRARPQFEAIVRSIAPPQGSDEVVSEHTEMDFWVGSWELQDRNGDRIATTKVTARQNGYVLEEQWHVAKQQNGTVLTWFDPAEEIWKQTRVRSDGQILQLSGKFVDEGVTFTGRQTNQDGTVMQSRLRFVRSDDDNTVKYSIEESPDGDEWKLLFNGTWVPQTPRLSM